MLACGVGGLLVSPHKPDGLVLEEDAVVGPLFIQKLSTIKHREFHSRCESLKTVDMGRLLTFLSLDSVLSSFMSPYKR